MKHLMMTILFASLISCTERSSTKSLNHNTAPSKQPTPAPGQRLFVNNCARCHGYDGQLCENDAADLSKSTLSPEDVRQQIELGKNSMPGFNDLLTESELEEVSEYVIQLRK